MSEAAAPPGSSPIAELSGVDVGYPQRPVLTGVDLVLSSGELLFVVGPNGAGKSTLVKCVAGLLPASRGSIRVLGTDPGEADRRHLARRLAYLPQSYRMSFPFTAMEIVLMGRYAHARRLFETDDDVRAAEDAMSQCGVLELASRRFDELSGGEMRRVLLAQALCQGSELLLLDEPTIALDPAHAIGLFEVLAAADLTTLVVSHDLNLAARFADRIVLIADGSVAADGPPAEVLASEALAHAFGVRLTVGTHGDGITRYAVPR